MHVGHLLTNKYDGMKGDIMLKRGQYVQKNCELLQEFCHCLPRTKFKINEIYNLHLTGSPLWNLFSKECEMMEKSWNVSVRCMFNLPMRTHKYFIEPITKTIHLKFIMMKRFLSFLEKIRRGKKHKLSHILHSIENDCRSITGSNLRKILLLTERNKIEDIQTSEALTQIYEPVPESEQWRLGLLMELIDIRDGQQQLDGFDQQQVEEMINFICIT